MSIINKIIPRKIFDSNGYPALEIEVLLDNGISAKATAPKLPRFKELLRYYTTNRYGKVVLMPTMGKMYGEEVVSAIIKINESLAPEMESVNVNNLEGVDSKITILNGTKNRFNNAFNITLALSNAIAKVAALSSNLSLHEHLWEKCSKNREFELPVPLINIFDGGLHTNNNLICKSIMVVSKNTTTFKEAIRVGTEIFHNTKKVLHQKGYNSSVGDQGGYATVFGLDKNPNVVHWESLVTEALEIVMKGIKKAGYKPGTDVYLAINVDAENAFYADLSRYALTDSDNKLVEFNRKEIVSYFDIAAKKYPISFIGNCLGIDDNLGWHDLFVKLGEKIHISGNDILFNQADDKEKIQRYGVLNNVMISLDRVFTMSDILEKVHFARSHRLSSVICNGFGDDEDDVIADYAAACNISFLSVGGACRTEKMTKYNQLIRLEEEFSGKSVFRPKNLVNSFNN